MVHRSDQKASLLDMLSQGQLLALVFALVLLSGCNPGPQTPPEQVSQAPAPPVDIVTDPASQAARVPGSLFFVTQGLYEEAPMHYPFQGWAVCGTVTDSVYLRPATLKIKAPQPDAKETTEQIYHEVQINGCNDTAGETPWFFVEEDVPFKAGEIITLTAPKSVDGKGLQAFNNPPLTENPLTTSMDKTAYILQQAKHKPTASASGTMETLELTLTNGKTSQALVKSDFQFTPIATVLWAGDMDSDRKLDLLINRPNNADDFGSQINELYLSTYAKGKDLVGLAGKFTYYITYD